MNRLYLASHTRHNFLRQPVAVHKLFLRSSTDVLKVSTFLRFPQVIRKMFISLQSALFDVAIK